MSRTSWPNAISSRAQWCADAHSSMPTTQPGRSVSKPITSARLNFRRTRTPPSLPSACAEKRSSPNPIRRWQPPTSCDDARRGPTTAASLHSYVGADAVHAIMANGASRETRKRQKETRHRFMQQRVPDQMAIRYCTPICLGRLTTPRRTRSKLPSSRSSRRSKPEFG